MKSRLVGLFTIICQLLIVSLFFVSMIDEAVVVDNYKTVVRNDNLDKIATSVSLLFKDGEISNNILVDDSVIHYLPTSENENTNFEEKIIDDVSEYQPLVTIDASKYSGNDSMGFKVTEGNKNYSLSGHQFDVVVAVVAGEFDKNLNDALAVVSVILNRCDSNKWSSWAGSSPYDQVVMDGQFEVYFDNYYLDFMPGGNKYGNDKYNIAKQAVIDGLNGIRNNNYTGFRAWHLSNYSNKYIVTGGNRYGYN